MAPQDEAEVLPSLLVALQDIHEYLKQRYQNIDYTDKGLKKAIREGRLKAYKVGRAYLVKVDDLDSFIKEPHKHGGKGVKFS